MLPAAAVCPHPRASAVAAVAALLAAEPDLLVVVGGATASATYAGPVAGSLRPFGIPWPAGSAEWLAGSRDPYRALGRLLHLFGVRRPRSRR